MGKTEYFGKIFDQIYRSSVAVDWRIRHVFQDMIINSDKDGSVRLTLDEFLYITRTPKNIVEMALKQLMSPDPQSECQKYKGARIIKREPKGWIVVAKSSYWNRSADRKERVRELDRDRQEARRLRKDEDAIIVTEKGRPAFVLRRVVKDFPISKTRLKKWEQEYPDMDIRDQLEAMQIWLKDNPDKDLGIKNPFLFILRWLRRKFDGGKYKKVTERVHEPSAADLDPHNPKDDGLYAADGQHRYSSIKGKFVHKSLYKPDPKRKRKG